MRFFMTILCCVKRAGTVLPLDTTPEDVLTLFDLPEDAANQTAPSLTYENDVSDYMLFLYRRMSEKNQGEYDKIIGAKTLNPDISSRLSLDLYGPLVLKVAEIDKLNLILTVNNSTFPLQQTNKHAQVCDNYAEHCSASNCIRQYDVETGRSWDSYDLSFLLQYWYSIGQDYVEDINLTIFLPNLSDYELESNNIPVIVFTKHSTGKNPSRQRDPDKTTSRTVRSAREVFTIERYAHIYSELEEAIHHAHLPRSDPQYNAGDGSTCHRHDWNIQFTDIGWDRWIIAPKDYPIGYCAGTCAEPLNATSDLSTNHAFTKSLWREINKQNYVDQPIPPPAHCSPFKLGSISFLYEYNMTIMVQTIQEMRIEQCGCI